MLNAETKRHIDAARDVLVGVAPNPMTQIDQITYALIYKFMDDMDQAAIKAGGEPSFFVGELEPYSWSKLVDARMGNQEKMNLYGEALQKFSEAKQLPELFRTIFRAAFLPYRSPETLGLFLKEINYFDYTHPEELGNAYEYLLSIMSAQGDAGQFRTPRHIIDFMVDVINPTKDDKVLDPACGTGGFLVASYNHILEQHDGKDDPSKKEKPLTPDERKKLMANFEGYDIDPSMVRIAQVNMYLHQFKNPKIFQYDSLTSEERWHDKFDVILANPPFMSPKGGIKPHNKFAIQSNRSEVLFVDYIANHLKPNGRAAIIVPEGIIFQSGKAYKQLRKELVEGGLYAVVSLPSGVFNPYSGVKTSILLINNEIAKQKDEILFVKITNDGYDLGATKRPIEKNDLPQATNDIYQWSKNDEFNSDLSSTISKKTILDSDGVNLGAERYRASNAQVSEFPIFKLGELISLNFGERITKKNSAGSKYPVYGGGGESFRTDEFNRQSGIVISRFAMSESCVRRVREPFWLLDSGATVSIQSGFVDRLSERFLGFLLEHLQPEIYSCSRGGAQRNLDQTQFNEIELPIPPFEFQEQIVAELDGYAAIIEGAKKIVENWKPRIDVDPEWPMKSLGDLCEVYQPKTISGSEILAEGPFTVYGANGPIGYYTEYNHEYSEVAVTCRGATCGSVNFTQPKSWITGNAMVISPKDEQVSKMYLNYYLRGVSLNSVITGSAQPQITGASLKPFLIPVPPESVQRTIVDGIQLEEEMVKSANLLALETQTRMQNVVAKLWSA